MVSWGLCRMAVRWGWRRCMGRTFLGMLPACELSDNKTNSILFSVSDEKRMEAGASLGV